MRVRTFTVPFAKIVGEDAHELDFGPEDRVVVRPLFGLSKADIEAWAARIAAVEDAGKEEAEGAGELADRLIIDLLSEAVIEWHLEGPEGPIGKPGTPEALNALPGAVAGSLYRFLTSYRGEAPGNPTIPR
jgi:hypothetical protein